MIEISHLQVERDGKAICAVDQLTVARGECLGVMGANGSGKTTLLRVVAGLTGDYAGSCQVAVSMQQRTYLHQQPFLFRGSVLANVRYGERGRAERRHGSGRPGGFDWLDRLQLDDMAARSTANLSGGERRRVALARALATRPQLLLLDEPFAELDDDAAAVVCETLRQLSDTTVVIASPTALPVGLVDKTFTIAEPKASRVPK